jgi:hypothetical protein
LKTLTKKLISLILSAIMTISMFPLLTIQTEAVTPTSNRQVWRRIENLRQLFPNNSFFSANGVAQLTNKYNYCKIFT